MPTHFRKLGVGHVPSRVQWCRRRCLYSSLLTIFKLTLCIARSVCLISEAHVHGRVDVVSLCTDSAYFDADSYDHIIPTAWIPLLDVSAHNGTLQAS